jgi:hypothetical protein
MNPLKYLLWPISLLSVKSVRPRGIVHYQTPANKRGYYFPRDWLCGFFSRRAFHPVTPLLSEVTCQRCLKSYAKYDIGGAA